MRLFANKVIVIILMTMMLFVVGCKKNKIEGNGSGGDSNNHAYVDLGLPSGLLWATCNVGADTPESCGDYFAWGETRPKTTYNWSTYKYVNGTSWEDPQLTKYCSNPDYGYEGFTDNLTILLSEDDAATVNWGSDWRIPTIEEWQELYDNTTVTWTTQNGVNGLLFTASSGGNLFLPATGSYWDDVLSDVGDRGFYCSGSLDAGHPLYACYFYFSSDSYSLDGIGRRDGGLSVRAVRSSQN